MNCTLQNINSFITIKEKCLFVSNNCSYEYINFYSFYYCYMNGSIIIISIIFIIFLIILFFILSSTSDIFLSSSITKLIETFNINENIAAVTLLDFGNREPNLI